MDENRKRKLEMEQDNVVNSSENDVIPEELNDMNDDNNENDDMSNQLRQFDVLDEVQGDESGSENGDIDHKGKT